MAACGSPVSPVRGSVFFSPAEQEVEVGQTVSVFATGLSADGRGPFSLGDVSWSSSDETVAVITATSSSGLSQAEAMVLGVSVGTARITGTPERGGSGSVTVVVIAPSPGS